MELDQDTLNQLFKEIFNLSSFCQSQVQDPTTPLQLIEQKLMYYLNQEKVHSNQFLNYYITTDSDVKLLSRFLSRISEAFALNIAKRCLVKSKASTFSQNVMECLQLLSENRGSVVQNIIQAVYKECRLQLDLLWQRLNGESDEKIRIHSQENEAKKDGHQPYYSMHMETRKNSLPEWQLQQRANRGLQIFYTKHFNQLYDVTGCDKHQDDNLVYYQSREWNMDKLYANLLTKNSNVKRSMNWASHVVDKQQWELDLNLKLAKVQSLAAQLPTQPVLDSPFKSKNIRIVKIAGKSTYSPSKPKHRSVSQNCQVNGGSVNTPNTTNVTPCQSENIKRLNANTMFLPSNLPRPLEAPINRVQIQFQGRQQCVAVMKKKLLIDLLPYHNKLKNISFRQHVNF